MMSFRKSLYRGLKTEGSTRIVKGISKLSKEQFLRSYTEFSVDSL